MPVLEINFLPGGNAKRLLGEGWSFQETIGVWTVGIESSLTLPSFSAIGACALSLEFLPYIDEAHRPEQRVRISLNGTILYSGVVRVGDWRISCNIAEGSLSTTSANVLTIYHPDGCVPSLLSTANSDPRCLSLCMRSVSLHWLLDGAAPDHAQPHGGEANERRIIMGGLSPQMKEIEDIFASFPLFRDNFELQLVDRAQLLPAAIACDSRHGRILAIWEPVTADLDGCRLIDKTQVPDHIQLVRVANPTITCLWPLQGHDPRLIPERNYPKGRYPQTDMAALALIDRAEHLDDKLYSDYLQLSAEIMPSLDEAWERDATTWRAIDLRCDIKVSEFIFSTFKEQRLFYAPDMLCAPLLIHLAEHLLCRALSSTAVSLSSALQEFVSYITGYQGMFIDQFPINPLVVNHFKLPDVTTSYEYRRRYMRRNFRDHILDYIRWRPWF
jgi:hypothetical protein